MKEEGKKSQVEIEKKNESQISNFSFYILKMLSLILACFLVSCNRPPLTVQSDYIHYEDLASYHVNTPDQKKEWPETGQRLYVNWNLDPESIEGKETELLLTVRYGTREEALMTYPVDYYCGSVIYTLMNDEYRRKKGIVTFRADIMADQKVVACWRHQLWTELIRVEPSQGRRSAEQTSVVPSP
jgi:hypothetical protein